MNLAIHCTDKNQDIDVEMLSYRPGVFLEVLVQGSIKMRMQYHKQNLVYVGNAAGLEFTIKEDQIPEQPQVKEFKRRR